MFDWLKNPPIPQGEARLPIDDLSIQVAVAVVAGFVVAGVFRATIVSRDRSAALPTTLVLLTVLTAIVTLVIGSNVARAFGLVGALSIVRFRTVVEDTRDTAFVIFAVVVGMAVGANYVSLAIISIIAVALVAAIMRWCIPSGRLQTSSRLLLTVRIASGNDLSALLAVLQKYAMNIKPIGAATAKQGAALEVTYSLRISGDPETMIPFVSELNKIEGIQSIELKENAKN